ncbi:methionyl-tRNA synthetase [Fistulifera solaris]|uniref:methionine--tRNA ligase n=1 Tax=Fistulifera solaris TaxID=1519565 RepID=A0A1Z5JZB0_FISSO|nr:methionyl-tRNA synthetase [Fistulifera solaris]|eukprot:GAX19337.1 methionyl-tRNA synthetase [Fistulifera solaris]
MILLALSAKRTVSAFTAPSHRLLLPKWTQLYSYLGTTATSFDDGKRPFQITTPIYYVNDKPHIGHAYTSIACDVIARFMRLSGREVFFLSGTDEHGQKVEQTAKSKGMEPQEFVDSVSINFRDLLELLNISNDAFIRTTEDHHKRAVLALFDKMVENGYIYLDNYEGWYSVRDECFYTESELIDGKAPTGAEVEWVAKEESYFFKLSAFQDKLLEFYEQNPGFIAPESRRNEVVSFVKRGLKDLSVSRTSFKWGIPMKQDPNHIFYVWVDALTNYISALGYPETGGKYKTFWPAALHIVGKDILRFHAIYWPAFLMAADLPLPKRLFAHGWWTKDGQKISKSLGNVIDPVDLVKKYGVDQTRFFLMAEVSFGNDGDFSDKAMITKVNTNLANELGNLCQRTLSMVFKNCDKAVPTSVGPFTEADNALLASARELREKAAAEISVQAIHKYVELMVRIVWETNKYIDEMEPWSLKKTDPERMATVLYVIMEVLRHVGILYQPLIPEAANKILDALSVPKDERTFSHLDDAFRIKEGSVIPKPEGVFPRMEMPVEELVNQQS